MSIKISSFDVRNDVCRAEPIKHPVNIRSEKYIAVISTDGTGLKDFQGSVCAVCPRGRLGTGGYDQTKESIEVATIQPAEHPVPVTKDYSAIICRPSAGSSPNSLTPSVCLSVYVAGKDIDATPLNDDLGDALSLLKQKSAA